MHTLSAVDTRTVMHTNEGWTHEHHDFQNVRMAHLRMYVYYTIKHLIPDGRWVPGTRPPMEWQGLAAAGRWTAPPSQLRAWEGYIHVHGYCVYIHMHSYYIHSYCAKYTGSITYSHSSIGSINIEHEHNAAQSPQSSCTEVWDGQLYMYM